MFKKIEGIVVSEVDYKESSKIINILTPEYGIIGVIARGTKRVNSILKSVATKMTYGYFHVKYSENGLSTLIEVDVIDMFKNIGINFKTIHLIDSRIEESTMKEYLKDSNIIFLMGGDPEEQMAKINEYHLTKIIQSFQGLILGVSAGSMTHTGMLYLASRSYFSLPRCRLQSR